jgi:hypothetical protein
MFTSLFVDILLCSSWGMLINQSKNFFVQVEFELYDPPNQLSYH